MAAIKSLPPQHSSTKRARPELRPDLRTRPPSTMRSTVMLSLLLCPDGGVEAHRHGQGAGHHRTR
jgi:hypothetical protein